MALKNMIARFKTRRRDAGFGVVDAVAGIGLAAVVIGGPILFFTTVNQNAAGNSATEAKNTTVSQTLDRAVANIRASDSILYAAPDELVTSSTEVDPGKADNPVITRWVANGTTLYQQVWSGTAGIGAYNRDTPVTDTSVTRVSVEGLQPSLALFSYNDKDGKVLDVTAPKAALTQASRTSPADGKTTYDIALVNLAIKATTTANGKAGVVENKTSVAPRSVSGKSNGVAAAQCPAFRLDTSTTGKPVITWTALAGHGTYSVMRNSDEAAVVTVPAGATQGSWTDAKVATGPAEVVYYRVQAQNADGSAASITCTPKPWSPQVAAPAFKGSAVLPSAAQAHEWTDGADAALMLTKPRITLKWDAVPGAESYSLKYRQLDPATGTPLTPAYSSAAANLPPASTSFTWDQGGWASSYEWFIVANAKTGQSPESTHIKTLTHPPAPQNVAVAPRYGTGSVRLTMGDNVITWDAAPTAVDYAVWRYTSGTTGPVTLLGTVPAGTRTYTDTVPYGTTYTYYVAAINDGPRGNISGKASSPNPEANATAATGVMPTVSFRHPAEHAQAMTAASFKGTATLSIERVANTTPVNPAPPKVSQLQYPPVPDEYHSRDWDGYNAIAWKPTQSAIGYKVARFEKTTGLQKCLTASCDTAVAGGITATTLSDTNLPKGSKYDYAVKAYNATGVSVDYSTKVAVTQRPAAPKLAITRAPDEAFNSTDFRIVQNADDGNTGSNRFCTAATCKYELDKTVTTPTTQTSQVQLVGHTQSGANYDFKNVGSPEGYTTTFSAKSKNEAVYNDGWSDKTAVKTDTLPGRFWIQSYIGDLKGGQVSRVRLDKVNLDGPANTNGATTAVWGPSNGATKFVYKRRALSGDVVNAGAGLSVSAAPGGTVNASSTGGGSNDTATPGAAYAYDVTATGVNGKTRKISTNPVITPAAISKTGTLQVTCAGSDWRVFTQEQLTPGGNYYAGAMSKPYSGQKVGARLIRSDPAGSWSFDAAPAYGRYKQTTYNGIVNVGTNTGSNKPPNGPRYSYTGWNYQMTGSWTPSKGEFSSGPGYGYWQGLRNGFQVITRGADFTLPDATGKSRVYTGPDSYALNAVIEVIGTFQFNNNCAPLNATGNQMTEPNTPCYNFSGSTCSRKDYATRPHWASK